MKILIMFVLFCPVGIDNEKSGESLLREWSNFYNNLSFGKALLLVVVERERARGIDSQSLKLFFVFIFVGFSYNENEKGSN